MEFIKPIFIVYSIEENFIESSDQPDQILRSTLREESHHETEMEALQTIDELCRASKDALFTYLKIYKSIG